MKEVSRTLYLVKRGEVWHYHRRVPTQLVPIVGRQFVKKSLGVTDLKSAQRLRNALTIKVDAEFEAAERAATNAGTEDTPTAPISLGALTEYLRQHVTGLDERAIARLTTDPPEDEGQRSEMRMEAEIALQTLKTRGDPNGEAWIDSTENKLVAAYGARLEDKEIVTKFAEVVRRGLIELQNRKLDRLDYRHDRSFHDPLFDPLRAPAVTFGALADTFWAERSEEYRENGVSAKRADKVKAELSLLCEAIGAETPLSAISDDTVQAVRSLLSRLPANRKKVYPKLSLSKAIEKAQTDGRPPLDPVTQAQYLRALRDVLAVGLRKGLIRHNPAADVKPIKKSKLSAAEKRLPWTDDQIIGFFTGKFYQRFRPQASQPYTNRDRGWRFWVPLLMLLTGARPNEICQLLTADLKRTKSGTWYLDLIECEDDDSKSIKTESSRRRVPLHPELIKISFLSFVEERRKKHGRNELRLFPEIKPDKYGNMAAYPTRRFREHFIPAEITLGKRQVFYSLRHNVRDALRRAKAPPETLLAVTGWSPSGKAVSDDYGDPGNPDLHIEWVERIAYPGLDLGFLYAEKADK